MQIKVLWRSGSTLQQHSVLIVPETFCSRSWLKQLAYPSTGYLGGPCHLYTPGGAVSPFPLKFCWLHLWFLTGNGSKCQQHSKVGSAALRIICSLRSLWPAPDPLRKTQTRECGSHVLSSCPSVSGDFLDCIYASPVLEAGWSPRKV